MAERIDTAVAARGVELVAAEYLTDEQGAPLMEELEHYSATVYDYAAFEVTLTLRKPGAHGNSGPARDACMRIRIDAARRLHALLGVAIQEHDIGLGFQQANRAARPTCSHGEYTYDRNGTKVCRKCGQ